MNEAGKSIKKIRHMTITDPRTAFHEKAHEELFF